MTQVKFIRTTHENGRCRPFSSEVMQFWREHGEIVGEVLRPEASQTFAEIVAVCREYSFECPESSLYQTLDEAHIAWCLIKLLEFGMAGVVAEVVSATEAVF